MPAIGAVGVGDHRNHIEICHTKHRAVTGSDPGERVGQLVSSGGNGRLRPSEPDRRHPSLSRRLTSGTRGGRIGTRTAHLDRWTRPPLARRDGLNPGGDTTELGQIFEIRALERPVFGGVDRRLDEGPPSPRPQRTSTGQSRPTDVGTVSRCGTGSPSGCLRRPRGSCCPDPAEGFFRELVDAAAPLDESHLCGCGSTIGRGRNGRILRVAPGIGQEFRHPIGIPEEERPTESLSRCSGGTSLCGHPGGRLPVERVVHHLDDIEIRRIAGDVRHGSGRCGAEDDSGIVRFGHGHQQGEPRPNVRTPPDRNLSNHEVVPVAGFGQAVRIDPVPGDEFGRLAGERVGLVRVRASRPPCP